MKQSAELSEKEKEYYLSGKIAVNPIVSILSCVISIAVQTFLIYRQDNAVARLHQIVFLCFSVLGIVIVSFLLFAFRNQRNIIYTMFVLIIFFELMMMIASLEVRETIMLLPLIATMIISALFAILTLKDTIARLNKKKLSKKVYTAIGLLSGAVGIVAVRFMTHYFNDITGIIASICGIFMSSFLFFYVLNYLLKQIAICRQENDR